MKRVSNDGLGCLGGVPLKVPGAFGPTGEDTGVSRASDLAARSGERWPGGT